MILRSVKKGPAALERPLEESGLKEEKGKVKYLTDQISLNNKGKWSFKRANTQRLEKATSQKALEGLLKKKESLVGTLLSCEEKGEGGEGKEEKRQSLFLGNSIC